MTITKEEIKKLARRYVDSLTDRERLLDTRLVNSHGGNFLDLSKGFEGEEISLTRKMEVIIGGIEDRLSIEEIEKFESMLSEEINRILLREPIIETKAEVVEAKKGPEGSSKRFLI